MQKKCGQETQKNEKGNVKEARWLFVRIQRKLAAQF